MLNQDMLVILGISLVYIVGTTALGVYSRRYLKNTDHFMTAGKSFPPFIVGVLMMSEFIGTGSTMGTAQTAFSKGISAAWNLITLAIAFVLFAYLLARKFHERGEYTISGAIAKTYGRFAQWVTSLIMIYALGVVNVSMYSGGAATLSALLHIPTALAAVLTGLITVLYVSSGGLFAVAYTNLVHAFFKYLGLILALAAGLAACGGYSALVSKVHPSMLQWDTVGWPTIIAWTLANIGSVFSTQYIIQGICSLSRESEAKKASLLSGLLIVPVGIMAALIGIAASVLFHGKPSAQAFPLMVTLMNPFLGGLVVGGLIAAVFGTVAAGTIGSAALIIKDFYLPWVKERPSDEKLLFISRCLTIVMGLLPIPFAIFAPQILNTIFFARALRTTIAVVVVWMFYAPG
ncbi:MAG: sodium:solute symporter family protein, partial [Alicyclobacillus sp.]|nr:sodium:solute symporter family protein [Alicyclobacillus sp.]